jgi:hypothetical protein
MSERDLEKILGGFAANRLMPEDRVKLYTAAMQDQQVFNALADEEALKELLADPLVRDRLLQAVREAGTSTAGGSFSWWNWLRRPAGLAVAGGLVAGLFAVAFGTKMYQESLERGPGTVPTENAPRDPVSQTSGPSQPSSLEPLLTSTVSIDSVRGPAKNEIQDDTSIDRKKISAPAAPQEQQAGQDATRQQARRNPASPATAASPQALQVPASTPNLRAIAPTVSARAMFYGIEPGSNSAVGSASPAIRLEDQAKGLTAAGKTTEVVSSKPLGLRYSFVARDTDGRERALDAVAAGKSAGPVRISVESSLDAYLQILQTLGTAGTRLWWPPQETGKISLQVLAGQRNDLPLPPPAENGLLSLIVRLSRKPFAPLTMQEVGMLDRFAANLLIESVAAGETGAPDRATYVVSQDSSQTAQMTVEIPIRR